MFYRLQIEKLKTEVKMIVMMTRERREKERGAT